MGWRDHLDAIETCSFDAVEYLAEQAASDETTPDGFMKPKTRPSDVWFHIPEMGCSCLWFPKNRTNTIRFSHCYVVPEGRGDGRGKAMAVYRYQYAKKHPQCERMDVLATHSPGLFADFGMDVVEKRAGGDIFYMAMELDGD